jgi:hypothetical protein
MVHSARLGNLKYARASTPVSPRVRSRSEGLSRGRLTASSLCEKSTGPISGSISSMRTSSLGAIMSPELAKRLALVFPTAPIQKAGVTGVAGVADVASHAEKPQQIRQLRPLRLLVDTGGKDARESVATYVAPPAALDIDGIEERAALAADSVPGPYLVAWARLQVRKPNSVGAEAWWRAIDDAGHFLDQWGTVAVELDWTARELIDLPREGRSGALIWTLRGQRVERLRDDEARLSDGRIIVRKGLPDGR